MRKEIWHQLVQIQEVAFQLGEAITPMIVALPMVQQMLQQNAAGMEQDIKSDFILDGAASTRLGHVMHLAAISFRSLSDKRRREVVTKFQGPPMS